MSVLRASIYANSLNRNVTISVILPIENDVPNDGYKTLYLLNGYMGDDLDWLVETRIKRLAMDNNIAVVMPAGENGFYVDDNDGRRNYSTYVGEELVNITRAMFPLSDKREDTFIAGLSMGGYGALNNSLLYNETFGAVGAFSLALVNELDDTQERVSQVEYVRKIFGTEVSDIRNTKWDPRFNISDGHKLLPKIYIACGKQDYVLRGNQSVHNHLQSLNIDHTYVLEDGEHNWTFWNVQIEKFIQWLSINN